MASINNKFKSLTIGLLELPITLSFNRRLILETMKVVHIVQVTVQISNLLAMHAEINKRIYVALLTDLHRKVAEKRIITCLLNLNRLKQIILGMVNPITGIVKLWCQGKLWPLNQQQCLTCNLGISWTQISFWTPTSCKTFTILRLWEQLLLIACKLQLLEVVVVIKWNGYRNSVINCIKD